MSEKKSDRLEELKYISSLVADWLKHLENKNTTFLVFLTAAITLIVTLLSSNILTGVWVCVISIATIISICSLLISFVPCITQNTKGKTKQEIKNIIFFGEIAKTNLDAYIDALSKTEGICENSVEFTNYEKMIVSDIWNNSKIAVWKARWFKWAIFVFLLGVITATVFFFVFK